MGKIIDALVAVRGYLEVPNASTTLDLKKMAKSSAIQAQNLVNLSKELKEMGL